MSILKVLEEIESRAQTAIDGYKGLPWATEYLAETIKSIQEEASHIIVAIQQNEVSSF